MAADTGDGARARCRDQGGSALLLIPAGFLAVLVLAALAVDQARILGMRRELVDLSASIAADAVAGSLDPTAYHETGDLVATEARGRALLEEQLATRGLTGRVSGTIIGRDDPGGPVVEVALQATATSLFARLAPGGWTHSEVRASSTAALDAY